MKLLRDPIALTELATELREWAEHVAKSDDRRAAPRVRRLRLAAREMEQMANRGGRLDALDAEE